MNECAWFGSLGRKIWTLSKDFDSKFLVQTLLALSLTWFTSFTGYKIGHKAQRVKRRGWGSEAYEMLYNNAKLEVDLDSVWKVDSSRLYFIQYSSRLQALSISHKTHLIPVWCSFLEEFSAFFQSTHSNYSINIISIRPPTSKPVFMLPFLLSYL